MFYICLNHDHQPQSLFKHNDDEKADENDLDLTFKLAVHSSRGFPKLLIQTLPTALVSRDCPIPGWQIEKSNDDDNDKMLLLMMMIMDTVIVYATSLCMPRANHMYTTCIVCIKMIT